MPQIIVLAPLVGALIAGFGWRITGERAAEVITTAILFLCMALAWVVFFTLPAETRFIPLFRWIESGSLSLEWGIRLDRLSAIMLVVVTSVSALVHLYSVGYMAHDDNWRPEEAYRARFFGYLSFFTFTMLALVTADNIVQLFFGWEGVGLASYLLIGFYFKKDSANAAAMKAFIVNRVGDFGFLLGMFALFFMVDSLRFEDIFAAGPMLGESRLQFLSWSFGAADIIMLLLFLGAMGKSAQLFLHTWLPDAMEGPTPVSALIHAATMVTAGVFLVCRLSPVLEYADTAKLVIVATGAATAFVAATIGLVQNDIKRVIAYSTCSQLGYMFVAAGLGVYSVAMFHLFTHAFFKALLFLCSGSVIVAMHHEQDMRRYGGLRKYLPWTYWTMVIGTLSITGVGIPLTGWLGFAGFVSKDAIIESAWAGNSGAFWLLVIAAVLTSFYSWRLIFMTFHGKPRWQAEAGHGDGHALIPQESPRTMLIPLVALAVGAVFSGMVWYKQFWGDEAAMRGWFGMEATQVETAPGAAPEAAESSGTPAAEAPTAAVAAAPPGALFIGPENHIIHEAHEAPVWVKLSPFLAMLLGLWVAWMFYIRRLDWPARLAAAQRPLYLLFLNKWYFDHLYDAVFVRGIGQRLARFLWKQGDGSTIDGVVNGVALGLIPRATRSLARLHSGYVFTYALWMVLGIAALITWVTLGGGRN